MARAIPDRDVFDTFTENVEERHAEMITDLESISVDALKTEGVSISFGGKTFKFSELEVSDNDDVEEKIRKEFKEKINVQQTRIREKINTKINQLYVLHQSKQEELNKKERELKLKYKNTAMMPEITQKHCLKGLSVVKGQNHGELMWIYKAVYNPRFIVIYDDGSSYSGSTKKRKPIPARLVTRCKQDMILQVITKGDQITSISTRKNSYDNDFTDGLPHFPHYHQTGTSDCWGSWDSYRNARWKTPDDILHWCKDAEGVLETINQGSVANRGPAGLPRMKTLLDAVENVRSIKATTVEHENEDDDVWEAV